MMTENGPHLLGFSTIEEDEVNNGDGFGRKRCYTPNHAVFGLEHHFLAPTNTPIKSRCSISGRSHHKSLHDQVLHLEPVYTPKTRNNGMRHSFGTFDKPLSNQNKSIKRASQCPPSWIEATNSGESLFEFERDELMQIHRAYSLNEEEDATPTAKVPSCDGNTDSNLDLLVSSAKEFGYPVGNSSRRSSEDDSTARIPPTLEQLFERMRTFDEEDIYQDATDIVELREKFSYDGSSSLTNSDSDSPLLLPCEQPGETYGPLPTLEKLLGQVQTFDEPNMSWIQEVYKRSSYLGSSSITSSEDNPLPLPTFGLASDFYGTGSGSDTPALVACSFDTADSEDTGIQSQISDNQSPQGKLPMGSWETKTKVDHCSFDDAPSAITRSRSHPIEHVKSEDALLHVTKQQGKGKKKTKGHKKLLKAVKKSILHRNATR